MRPSPSGVWLAAAIMLVLPPVARPAAGQAGAAGEGGAPAGLENIGAGQPAEGATLAAAAQEGTAATEVVRADDAYHYPAWRDARHDAFYTEWWYFNFHDARAGVDCIFSYFVIDPEDIGGIGQVQMVAVAYTREGTVTAIDRYPAAAFQASDQEADVRIGGNGARVGADGSYRVSGQSLDGRLAWDLKYVADSVPWFGADRMTVGRLAWEKMSWLVQMPRARVTGTVTIDGRAHAIRATGYHDHNWGEWIPTDATWNWAQFSSPRLSLEVGDFIGKPIGVVALDLDGARTVFTPDQYSLVHTRWGWDRVNRLFFPTESLLTADNGALRLEVTLRALKTEPLRGDLPRPLRDLIIYEQTARYDGVVREWVEEVGEWRVRAWLRGTGFKEWTGKKY